MKKKIVTLLTIASVLGATLVSCGGGEDGGTNSSSTKKNNPSTTLPTTPSQSSTTAGSKVDEDLSNELYYYDSYEGSYLFNRVGKYFTLSLGGDTYSGTIVETSDGYNLVTKEQTYTALKSDNILIITAKNKTYSFLKHTYYNVSFMDGDNCVSSLTVLNGKTIEPVETPEYENKTFVGWCTDKECLNLFDYNNAVTSDLTLYAKYVSTEVGNQEYTVNFVYDGKVLFDSCDTVAGVVYNLPTPKLEGKEFVGWWYSDLYDETKLTAKYTGQKLQENTTLYAVFNDDELNLSVLSDKITWANLGKNLNYNVVVENEETGESYNTTINTNSLDYDFTSKESGIYKVTVSNGNKSKTAYYYNNKLPKISKFDVVEPGILVFNQVEDADWYEITVSCGDNEHNHTSLYLGKQTYFDFSNCEMKKGGIKFVVKAYTNDGVFSQTEFYYDKTLSNVTDLMVKDDVVMWNSVENAVSYNLEVTLNGETTFYTLGNENFFSLNDYSGEMSIKVYPVSKGYNSPDGITITYNKTKLATPLNIVLENDLISWDDVVSANGYKVYINGVEYVTETNEFTLTNEILDLNTDLVVKVMALASDVNNNSYYSQSYKFEVNSINGLGFSNNELYWNNVLGATKYSVILNDGVAEEVTKNHLEVSLNKEGINTFKVAYYDRNGLKSDWYTFEVMGYGVYFNPCTDDSSYTIPTKYYSLGDKVELPEAVNEGYNLTGWYNIPNGPKYNGYEYNDLFKMPAHSVVLFAYWSAEGYDVTFDLGEVGELEEEFVRVYYEEKFTLPVPSSKYTNMFFDGWYTEANGQGEKMTDYYGKSVSIWNYASNKKLYANFVNAVDFEAETDNEGNVLYYNAIPGAAIDRPTEITIPVKYNNYYVKQVKSLYQARNLVTLNIPDTVEYVNTIDGFSGCYELRTINVYDGESDDDTKEKFYTSYDGVLYYNNTKSDNPGWEVKYFPTKKTGRYKVMEGCVNIPLKAFYNSKITSFTIPYTVTTIGDRAFYNCTLLTNVEFESTPEEEKEQDLSLGAELFSGCKVLKEIYIPARVTNLSLTYTTKDESVFSSCESLEKIFIDENNAQYSSTKEGIICNKSENEILYVPKSLTGSYAVDAKVKKIAKGAFAKCTLLTEVTIPFSVEEIGEQAFYGCSSLAKVNFISDEDADLVIKTKAFYNCALGELVIPENVHKIEKFAFGGNKNINSVEVYSSSVDFDAGIVASATSAGKVSSCYVEEVYIGEKVPTFDINSTFSGDKNNLVRINVSEKNPNFKVVDNVLYNTPMEILIFYPKNKAGEFVVPDTVKTISSGAFKYNTVLTKVTIGKNVTQINDSAFSNCTGLESVVFNDKETTNEDSSLVIGNSVFSNCSKLTNVVLSSRVTSLGASAFYNCKILNSISLPEGLTSIGDSCFDSCRELEELYIPSTLVDLGGVNLTKETEFNCFNNCISLKKIEVSEDNKTYASYLGSLYTKENGLLTKLCLVPRGIEGELVIPKTVNKIFNKALYINNNITSVSFEDNMSAYNPETNTQGTLTIGTNAFYSCGSLKKASLPNLTTLSNGLFQYCSSLESFEVPYTVTKIDKQAFYYCSSLKNITFEETPEGVTPFNLEFVNCSASTSVDQGVPYVSSCTSPFWRTALTEVELPERTTIIGNYVFYGLSNLRRVYVPSTVTTIGNYVFASLNSTSSSLTDVTIAENSKLTKIGNFCFQYAKVGAVNLPDSVITLGSNAFNQSYIKSISIPANLNKIDTNTFYNCNNLTEVDFSKCTKLIEIGSSAFYGCNKLSSVSLPESLQTIGSSAFKLCSGLSEVEFKGNNVSKLNNECFSTTGLTSFTFPEYTKNNTVSSYATLGTNILDKCIRLETISLSGSVNKINGVLGKCPSLTDIKISSTNKNFVIDDDTKIVYNIDKTTLKFAVGNYVTDFRVPDTVLEIEDGAFANNKSLTTLYIPNSVQKIGKGVFTSCTNLISVEFESDSAIAMGEETFSGCTNLLNVTLPDKLIVIPKKTFFNCSSLASISCPNVTEIGDYGFDGCKSLENFVLSDKLTSVGEYSFCDTLISSFTITSNMTVKPRAFLRATNLSKLTIKEGVEKIDVNVFMNCTGLTSVELPNSLVELGNSAFYGCSNLSSIKFGNNIQKIGNSAFSGCGLISMTIPTSVSSIGTSLFNACLNLTSVTLPNSLSTLPDTTFKGCTSLKNVNMPDTISYIGKDAFYNCTSLTDIVLPENLIAISSNAFRNTGLVTVQIPKGVKALGVTSATASSTYTTNAYVFADCLNLTEVEFLGDALTDIPKYLFYNTPSLKTVKLSKATTKIGQYAFQKSGIQEIDLSNFTTIDKYVFKDAVNLSNVKLGSQITSISANLFNGCQSLTSISIPASVNEINNYAFANTGLVTFDAPNVTKYYDNAFQNCKQLSNVTLSDNTVELGKYVFSGCDSLETLELPDSITKIGLRAFENSGLKSIKLSSSLTTLENLLFDGCLYLSDVDFGNNESLTALSYGLFQNCKSLKSVNIPSSVTKYASKVFAYSALESLEIGEKVDTFGDNPFLGCSNLKLTVNEKNDTVILDNNGVLYSEDNELVSVPTNYQGELVIREGCSISSYAFEGCTGVTKVVVNDLTELSTYAFANCESIEEVVLPSNMTTINSNAFKNTPNLKKITLPEGLTSLKSYSFDGSGITSIVIPAGVEKIESNTFVNCANLASVELNNVNCIDSYAFKNCTSLKEINLTHNIKTLGTNVFYASGLESVVVPNSLTTFGNGAFWSCESLKTVTFEDGLTIIPKNILSNCTSLETVNIPASVTTISASAFSDSGLKSFVVPDTVLLLGESCFAGCASLTSVTLSKSLVEIPKSCFSNTGLTEITIPFNIISLANSSFAGCASLTNVNIEGMLKTVGYSVFNDCTAINNIYFNLDQMVSFATSAFENWTSEQTIRFNIDKKSFETLYSGSFTNCGANIIYED